MRCIIYSSHWLRTFYRSLSRVHSIYLHWRGAFGVARFDKLGDARASTRGTSDRIGSALFSYVLVSEFRQQGVSWLYLLTELE